MKVLMDECSPKALKRDLADHGHECVTVQQAGWAGKKNGELLELAEPLFDVFVTLDTNMRYQQGNRGKPGDKTGGQTGRFPLHCTSFERR